jgi:hypothetical protein
MEVRGITTLPPAVSMRPSTASRLPAVSRYSSAPSREGLRAGINTNAPATPSASRMAIGVPPKSSVRSLVESTFS